MAVDVHSPSEATLITGDSMSIIKVWSLERSYGDSPSCRATEKQEISIHRTGINDLWFANGELWTGKFSNRFILRPRPGWRFMFTPLVVVEIDNTYD